MKDLITLVKYYIENNNPPKVIDCTYSTSPLLTQIASLINDQGNSKRRIITRIDPFQVGDFISYSGKFTDLGLEYIGLKQGIKEVYNKLK